MGLYLFDLDCTLIEGFIETVTCKSCGGDRRAREENGEPMDAPCPRCHGSGEAFGEPLPYDRVVALDGRYLKLQELAATPGVCFGIVTNQAGVAFGHQTQAQVAVKMALVLHEFNFFFGCPVSLHIAYEHEKATIPEYHEPEPRRRKPAPGMLYEAMIAHRTGPEETLFVGDMDSDREAAVAAGVAFADAEEFFGSVG